MNWVTKESTTTVECRRVDCLCPAIAWQSGSSRSIFKCLPDRFHPLAIDAQVGPAGTRRRAKVDRLPRSIEQEFDIVHVTKQGTGKFYVQVVAVHVHDASTGLPCYDCLQALPGFFGIAGKLQ